MTPTISIIMPVYNAGERLEAAVASVCTQGGVPLELLLIDDGSTDGSGERCQALASRHENVRVLHQPNRGICAARNAGMAAAGGEYLAFCDDDDTYLPGFLARALALARENDADLVRMEYRLFREPESGALRELPHTRGASCVLRKGDSGADYDAFLRRCGPLFVWNVLYRRAFLGELRFEEGCKNGLEDFVFNAACHAKCPTMVYDPQVAYLHVERGGTSTSQMRSEAALRGRFGALAPWMTAEYRAAAVWCGKKELAAVWNERKACAVTLMMHQLRDADAAPAFEKESWQTLRQLLNRLQPPRMVDFLQVAGQNRKQMAALLLYALHLTGCYRLLRNKEEIK